MCMRLTGFPGHTRNRMSEAPGEGGHFELKMVNLELLGVENVMRLKGVLTYNYYRNGIGTVC